MKLFFRTDANNTIATGHLMRCISIADELQARGDRIVFLIADQASIGILDRYKYDYFLLEAKWDQCESGLAETVHILMTEKPDMILVDSYYVDETYLRKLSEGTKVAYLGSKEIVCPQLSLLINYSNLYNAEFYKANYQATKLLLGPKYSPLRRQFHIPAARTREKVNRIFVSVGGSDTAGVTLRILKELESFVAGLGVQIKAIAGAMNQSISELQAYEAAHSQVHVLVNVVNMAEIMLGCDLAISAAGTTINELCACGVPTVCFAVSKEQEEQAKQYEKEGVAIYCGNIVEEPGLVLGRVITKTEMLFHDYQRRSKMAGTMRNLIDGKGCSMIADQIHEIVGGAIHI